MTATLNNNRLSTSNSFSQGGNGKYRPLKTRKNNGTTNSLAFDPFNPSYDRMRFKNSRDPIFVAFDQVEKQSPLKLAKDLIKESITDSINTIGQTLVTLFN